MFPTNLTFAHRFLLTALNLRNNPLAFSLDEWDCLQSSTAGLPRYGESCFGTLVVTLSLRTSNWRLTAYFGIICASERTRRNLNYPWLNFFLSLFDHRNQIPLLNWYWYSSSRAARPCATWRKSFAEVKQVDLFNMKMSRSRSILILFQLLQIKAVCTCMANNNISVCN